MNNKPIRITRIYRPIEFQTRFFVWFVRSRIQENFISTKVIFFSQRFNQNEPTISLGYFNNILFTYFQISKLTGLTLYEVSTQQPNVTATLTIQCNRVKSTNNPWDGRTQISHSVRYFSHPLQQQPNATTTLRAKVKSTHNPRDCKKPNLPSQGVISTMLIWSSLDIWNRNKKSHIGRNVNVDKNVNGFPLYTTSHEMKKHKKSWILSAVKITLKKNSEIFSYFLSNWFTWKSTFYRTSNETCNVNVFL